MREFLREFGWSLVLVAIYGACVSGLVVLVRISIRSWQAGKSTVRHDLRWELTDDAMKPNVRDVRIGREQP